MSDMHNELSPLEAASKAWLGSIHATEAWPAVLSRDIESPEPFYATEVWREVLQEYIPEDYLDVGVVNKQIHRFHDLGMVQSVDTPFPRATTTKFYKRIGSPGWKVVRGVLEVFNEAGLIEADDISRQSTADEVNSDMPAEAKLPRTESSKSFFGRSHRVDVWASVTSQPVDSMEPFYGSDLQGNHPELKIGDIGRELRFFEENGMIERTKAPDMLRNRAYYRRTESPWWKIVETAVEAFDLWYPAVEEEGHERS